MKKFDKNILFCGLPAAGKTTAASIAAERLGRQFIDSDRQLENLYRGRFNEALSARQIFKKFGEPLFRKLEGEVIASFVDCRKAIISLGGGAHTFSASLKLLKESGFLIFLKCDRGLIFERLAAQPTFPPYLDRSCPTLSLQELADLREPTYELLADHVIDVTRLTPVEVATRAIALL